MLPSITYKKLYLVAFLFFSTSAYAGDGNKCYGRSTNEISDIYKRISDIVKNNVQLEKRSIGEVVVGAESYNIMLITYIPVNKVKYKIFIDGGAHGDEPAGVESVISFIKYISDNPNKFNNTSIDFVPMLNPTGWIKCSRLTDKNLDINRDYHELTGTEVVIINNYLSDKKYDLMIDHHEDPRKHVHDFYIVTYGNDDISAIKTSVSKVSSLGYGLRKFRKTNGFFNVKKKKMGRLKGRTIMLYARSNYSENVYQVETPTTLTFSERVKLHNIANETLISSMLSN